MIDTEVSASAAAEPSVADPARSSLRGAVLSAARRMEDWLLCRQHATWGLAAARMVLGCAVLGLLLSNAADRQILWGSAAVWLEREEAPVTYPLMRFVGDLSNREFDIFYFSTVLLSVAFIVGWRTRLVTPLLMVASTSIIEQAPMAGDAGDNLIRVALILMCFLNASAHWSFDSRRHRVRWSFGRFIPVWLQNVVHNAALIALLSNVLFIYLSAGMYKLQGQLWQHGTALYYPLQLPEFRPFPPINDLLTHAGLAVGVLTYLTVTVQLFFAPMLLHRIARRVALAMVLMLHAGIALLMALPWFSLAMVSLDLVLISSATYAALEGRVHTLARRLRARRNSGASVVAK